MAEIPLTPKERQALKGRAHRLDPVVLVGAQGLSEAVVKEIDRALTAHELIKVRVPGDEREARETLFIAVAERLGAARVQAIGKLLVFYRPKPPESDDESSQRSPKAPRARPAARVATAAPQRGRKDREEVRRSEPRRVAPRRSGSRTR